MNVQTYDDIPQNIRIIIDTQHDPPNDNDKNRFLQMWNRYYQINQESAPTEFIRYLNRIGMVIYH